MIVNLDLPRVKLNDDTWQKDHQTVAVKLRRLKNQKNKARSTRVS